MRSSLFAVTTALIVLAAARASAKPEVIEIGPENKNLLPAGKEADGIVGDFLLRNDRVEAVISHNAPLRRANMSTFYGAAGVTPGCLYDLTLRGHNNDQITVFCPSYQQGPVSYVRAVEGSQDEAAVETVVTAASNDGLFRRHVYRLRDGWQGVLIVTTLRNEGQKPVTTRADDRWTNFRVGGVAFDGILWADAIDPADKAGYAYAGIDPEGNRPGRGGRQELQLQPGEEQTFARFLAVGRSPAEAVGVVAAMRGPTAVVSGTMRDGGGPVVTASLHMPTADKPLPAYPDAKGDFSFRVPPGNYALTATDIGRQPIKRDVTLDAGGSLDLPFEMSGASGVEFDITDDAGRSIPCKAQFIGRGGTKVPDLGPRDRAHGCVDQYHSETGRFRVQLPQGQYRVVVTRGTEFSHLAADVTVEAGKVTPLKGALKRLVQTPGWVSTDFHNHSTQSGDNTCGTDDRIINLAAEQIEFAPTTEHNRLYDWRPHIERLKLTDELNTVSGLELTGQGPHMNAFPFQPVPRTQDNGAPVWNRDPRIDAITLREHQGANPDRWVHINHPDMVENFVDRDNDGRADGGYMHLGTMLDAIETQNFLGVDILTKAPFRVGRNSTTRQEEVRYVTEFIWLQLLNRGHRLWGIAVSDAHSVHGNGVGGWRTYVRCSTDSPKEIDWQEISRRAKAGQMVVTTGPYLEVETADGVIAGGSARANGSINLKVRVQCTDWIDIDRVQVLVNGRQRQDVNFTRRSHPQMFGSDVVKFDQRITMPLSEDAHLIVVAYAENSDLSTGYGTSAQSKLVPCAYNNPIFVDVDGNGFVPNGDTLGFELPVKKLTVEEVKRQLKR